MTERVLTDRAGLDAARLAALQEQIADHRTLEAVVRWGLALGHAIADVVAQDEYSQDVVLRLAGDLYLVYDAT